jgi:hypothetical protein
MLTMIERSLEASAFFETLNTADPTAVSACDGWTTHDVVAHVAGIAVEVNRHLDPFLQGDAVPTTRSFEVREAPLRALDHAELLRRGEAEETQMRAPVAEVLARDPEAVIQWTGRQMVVATFITRLRNEHALHRWDMVGDDEVGLALLGQAALTEHSVEVLGEILLRVGRAQDPEPDATFAARLHVAGQPDLDVVVDDGVASLQWTAGASSDQPGLAMDAAARHLFVWGRRAAHAGRIYSILPQARLARLQILLSGY